MENNNEFSTDVLKEKIKEQEVEIAELKESYEKTIQDKNRIEKKYKEIQKSRIWRYSNIFRNRKPNVKKIVKSVLGKKGTETVKKTMNTVNKTQTNKKRAEKLIKRYRTRLYNYGFTDRGLADITTLYEQNDNIYMKSLAAWELAIWHINQEGQDGPRKSLEFLKVATEGRNDETFQKQVIVIEVECLERLGELAKARQIVKEAIEKYGNDTNLLLASANLEETVEKRLNWINTAFSVNGLSQVSLHENSSKTAYDQLSAPPAFSNKVNEMTPKVSVIIPAYNAEELIGTAIDAMLTQTWDNLEIFVVDDCSTDNTVSVIEGYANKDSRVKLLRAEKNGGPYIARNLALREATGEFVTINDADDWSHPEKIEKQVTHLINNPALIGNTSQQARATSDLKFSRRMEPGYYIFKNVSSFMFRRVPVMDSIGFWDCVRFAADSEYIRRIKKVFGKEAVVDLKTGPLSFQRKSDSSLTSNSYFGFPGHNVGARKEYLEALQAYHSRETNLKFPFPQQGRPFPVPEPMWPVREKTENKRRHFDVILASDFRLPGGTTTSNMEEIKSQKRMGIRTGLIQMYRYDSNRKEINPKIRDLVDGEQVQLLVYGEKVSCDLLILRHPPILQNWQKYLPDVDAKNICVIINQTPMREYGTDPKFVYDLKNTNQNLVTYFGKQATWYPIGPLVRGALHDHHSDELKYIELADHDWSNIIDVEEWKRSTRPNRGSRVRIGRHSRGDHAKWPADKNQLISIYPDKGDYEIHVLGGAEAPIDVMGGLPSNWNVLEFGEMDPKEFLAGLDVFVYYTHPDLVEAFGRVIIEAMAVGVPVIIPPHYQELFGEAAIYAEPNEVRGIIDNLMNDDNIYEEQVNRAHNYVEKHFGYTKHNSRVNEYIE
ncbi:glycosyltransferase [Bacillus alkalicellulosilyticus]|uniref:glycosyltransferase n=1 Tax=Alkalihalobacterium alkalicellulosilyticum TaxID=1912214 RepID=UPI0009986F4A|nr:glycosyltransferase [Bacillus alkalicellulosilyticus]